MNPPPSFGPIDLARLLRSRLSNPAARCLTFEGRTWSTSEVHGAADRMAGSLRAAGAGVGDVVAACCENRAEFLPLMLAVWSVGAALAPLSALLTAEERCRILGRLGPRLVVSEPSLDWPEGLLLGGPLRGSADLEIVVPAGPARQVAPGTALILHTSGTTAQPKAVAQSASNLIGAMESVLRLVRQGGGHKAKPGRGAPNLVAFPQAHLAGVFGTLLGFYNDREIVLMRRFDVANFLELVEQHRIPSVILNPTMVYMLCDAPASAEAALAPLRFVRSGSSRLSPALATRFHERFGVPVLNCYGQTETAGEVIGWTVPDLPRAAEKLGSVGRPHHGVTLRFVDEYLAEVERGEVGELCVKAPFIMEGYLDADRAADFIDGGFLRTGDLGRIDPDGFVWLVGRRKELISCGGFKILPEEVEDVLRSHPAVADVMVAGVPDERLGEKPYAFVVARADGAPDGVPAALVAELVDHARARLARYKLPREIRFVDALPCNANGKVVRARATELLAATDPALAR